MRAGEPLAAALTYIAAALIAFAASGCGSTVATSTGPSPTKCAVTVAAPSAPVSSGGATATVAVTTQPECAWSASSDAAWITGVAPASGQGSGEVHMQVAANPDATGRQGDIVVNGERARIRQDAAACRFELSSTEQTMPARGGSGGITVTAANGCPWSARADASWVVLTSGTSGTGTGNVNFTVAANSATTARSASITVAGQTVNVTQQANVSSPLPSACTVTVTPKDVTFGASGTSSSSIAVAAAPSCEWSATSNASWISLIGATSGTGNGSVTFSVRSNTGAPRSSSLTIGDQTVPINQLAGTTTCSYNVSPLTTSISAAGGAGAQIKIDTQTGCEWTAASNTAWLTVTSGASGSGDGSTTFTASANTGGSRSGTLTVAGRTVTVNQPSGCSYSVTPTTISISALGGTGTPVFVSTGSGCTWTATSSAGWITLLTGAAGTGPGSVTYAVLPNTGSARSATLTVAGERVSVSQSGVCSYTISPTSKTFEKSGGTGTVSVNTQPGCPWTAVSHDSWITVTNGSSGNDDGTVAYTVAPNNGSENRTGTLTIAGLTFTVTEKK
jgi:hypothetical protein